MTLLVKPLEVEGLMMAGIGSPRSSRKLYIGISKSCQVALISVGRLLRLVYLCGTSCNSSAALLYLSR